jgi:hypothetical protein
MPVAARPAVRLRLLLLLALLPLTAAAQSGQWGSRGITRRFVQSGRYLYAADGRGVAVYDTTQPPARPLATLETEFESVDVAAISGEQIVVATKSDLEVFTLAGGTHFVHQHSRPMANISHLAANASGLAAVSVPGGIYVYQAATDQIVRYVPISRTMNALQMRDGVIVAAVESEGIEIIDARGERETLLFPENAKDFAITPGTNILFIAAGANGLVAADFSDPWAPRVISRTASGEINSQHIAASDDRVALTENGDLVHLFDTTFAELPRLAGVIHEPAQAIALDGRRLYLSGSIVDQFGLTTETGVPLRTYDVGDLTAPRVLAEVRDLAGPVSGVATDGSLAYVVDRPLLRVIDISRTTSPREIASLAIDDIGDHVKLQGKQIILYGRGDVQLVDVGDPYHPRLVNVFHSYGRPPSNAAFTRNGIAEGNPWTGFHIVDFSYPTPAITASIKSHYFEIVSNGDDIVYAGAERNTIAVFDVGTPTRAIDSTHIPVGIIQADLAPASATHPPLLLVLGRDFFMHVYSLADRFTPVEMGRLATSEEAVFAAAADAAYIATGNGVISTIDLTDATSPSLSSSTMKAVAPMQLAVANGKIVVADRYSLRIYGADTPAPPPPAPPPAPARRRAVSR